MSRFAFAFFTLSCCAIAGCISSTVRYTHPADRPAGHAPARDQSRHHAVDEEDFGALLSDDTPSGANKTDRGSLDKVIRSYLGTPYHYGGLSRGGIDCSGLVVLVYKELNGADLPHSSRKLHKMGKEITLADARPGDLLFFRMGFAGFVDHVGICTGNGLFVHASSSYGVIESSMNDEHYRSHFIEARRLFP